MSKTIGTPLINISGSKSESNRALILQKIFNNIYIKNLSNSNDTLVLQKALNSDKKIINIGSAGTAMRFLTAYFAIKEKTNIVLTGSKRMQKRPIKILVDALKHLGADIIYLKEEGFPPLQIKGKKLINNEVSIKGNVSSQYVSALLLIAPLLTKGLIINLQGKVASVPYIKMTLSLLDRLGVKTKWNKNKIIVLPNNKINKSTIVIESDWSSASYFYSLVALEGVKKIELYSFKKNSIQGDKEIVTIYKLFGVKTTFKNDKIILEKETNFKPKKNISLNLIKTPDIAQTIVVTCLGLNISCKLTGLHTLKIKETDRLLALKKELEKFGVEIRVTNNSLLLLAPSKVIKKTKEIVIKTYQDHRMAMAFAPLISLFPIKIENKNVVKKSYPHFWKDFKKIGLKI